MTFTVPKWLVVVLALGVVGGAAGYGGYRIGYDKADADKPAIRAALERQASIDARASRTYYDHTHGWVDGMCRWVETHTPAAAGFKDRECPGLNHEGVPSLSDYDNMVTQNIKTICIRLVEQFRERIPDGGRCN